MTEHAARVAELETQLAQRGTELTQLRGELVKQQQQQHDESEAAQGRMDAALRDANVRLADAVRDAECRQQAVQEAMLGKERELVSRQAEVDEGRAEIGWLKLEMRRIELDAVKTQGSYDELLEEKDAELTALVERHAQELARERTARESAVAEVQALQRLHDELQQSSVARAAEQESALATRQMQCEALEIEVAGLRTQLDALTSTERTRATMLAEADQQLRDENQRLVTEMAEMRAQWIEEVDPRLHLVRLNC